MKMKKEERRWRLNMYVGLKKMFMWLLNKWFADSHKNFHGHPVFVLTCLKLFFRDDDDDEDLFIWCCGERVSSVNTIEN